jgi:hypothetical protein
MKMHVEPDPDRRISSKISFEALARAAAQSQDAFKTFVAEREKLQLFHNPSFAIYSQPGETRESFLARCIEEANHRLEDQTERLESTFRRRIDQVKERSERDKRDEDAKEPSPNDIPRENINMAWGQTLYNITSGKPAAVAEAPQSMLESDYMEKIAQIQRSWDKELQALREEIFAKAKEVEEITVTLSPKNIEVTRYLILWATRV